MNKASSGSSVTLEGVSKKFGDVVALHPVDLAVRAGEFFSVLGPSGSGKTTVLRLIAAARALVNEPKVNSRPYSSEWVSPLYM